MHHPKMLRAANSVAFFGVVFLDQGRNFWSSEHISGFL